MKLSYAWLKEYLPVNLPADQLADVLTGLGLEVSGVERTESVKGGLKGVVAGRVLTCEKHPNADRLSLTTVDIGSGSPLQIVCGAPNVAVDQTVWVATVGTVLYPSGNDEALKISKAKVRGETSEGMICAADELGLGEDHSGIMVLDDSIPIGTLASTHYRVTEDDVIEIELTPNRSDAISHLGVAEDLAAWMQVHGQTVNIRYPEIPDDVKADGGKSIPVEVRENGGCPRYCGVTISGVEVRESPDWLQNKLRTIGVKPINTIVDATNFVLHEMGQPLHAFDADKIARGKVIVQTLPEGTAFLALDGVEYKLSSEDLMICDGDGKGMCIAGVYGGIDSGITASTKRVFLESAHFHPRWIRRTSNRHDLRTDAARTFEKTTDPNICRKALIRAAELMVQLSGGQIASSVVDVYPEPVSKTQVTVRKHMIERIAGVRIPDEGLQKILAALRIDITSENKESIVVTVPTNKADVTREADVIEEILRIYGYNVVAMSPHTEIPLIPAQRNAIHLLRDQIGNYLSAQGFLEMMGMSLVESRNFEEGPLAISKEQRILIDNTSNVHLDLMRPSLLATALEAVRFNQNRMQTDLMLYEFGSTYQRKGGHIAEEERLSLSITGDLLHKGWRNQNVTADFFSLKKYVMGLLGYLGIGQPEASVVQDETWDFGQRLIVAGTEICIFGRVSQALCRQYDLRAPVYCADFSMTALHELSRDRAVVVGDISKFPAVLRDIAIVLPADIAYHLVEDIIRKAGGALLEEYHLFDVYENEQALGKGNRSLAIALTFRGTDRTLTDKEVNQAVDQIVKSLEKKAGASLR